MTEANRPALNVPSIDVDVAIIGAGPAGLTAGYLLTKAGKSVAIIEKDATYVGGISRTVEHEGYRFDIGGHRFFSKSQQVVDLWNEILPDDFIERPRMSRIYYEGKFYSYPLRAFEALRNLGLWRSTACMASYLWARVFPNRKVKSFEDWTTNQFGKKLYSIFFKTYTEKVWGMPCDEMSADWAAQRIKGLSLMGAVVDGLKRSLGLNKKPNDGMQAKTLLESFRYPRQGPGMMWEAARDKIIASGRGQVIMGHGLEQLASDGDGGWRMSAVGKDGSKIVVNAAHAISSAPMRELGARLHPLPETSWNGSNLRYRDFLTVALMVEGEDLFPDNWIYIHDSKVKVGRVQNFRSWSPEMIPDEKMACVGLEYFCFEGDGLWSMDDADLIELATTEMKVLGLLGLQTGHQPSGRRHDPPPGKAVVIAQEAPNRTVGTGMACLGSNLAVCQDLALGKAVQDGRHRQLERRAGRFHYRLPNSGRRSVTPTGARWPATRRRRALPAEGGGADQSAPPPHR